MVTKTIILKNEQGLHARPATEIVKATSQYTSTAKLEVYGSEYNAKSVLNIMAAGIKNGTKIKIICDGVDETQALSEIIKVFEENNLI